MLTSRGPTLLFRAAGVMQGRPVAVRRENGAEPARMSPEQRLHRFRKHRQTECWLRFLQRPCPPLRCPARHRRLLRPEECRHRCHQRGSRHRLHRGLCRCHHCRSGCRRRRRHYQVVAAFAFDQVVAFATDKSVSTRTAFDGVVAVTAINVILTGVTFK